MTTVTKQLVADAYAALATGERGEIEKFWDQDMTWLVPGHNHVSGCYYGLDSFIGFMGEVGKLSNFSFRMDNITTLTNEEYSADVTYNEGYRAGYDSDTASVPMSKLAIDVIHLLRWRDGKVIEGRGAIFGDGTNQYDQFWSPVGPDGNRLA